MALYRNKATNIVTDLPENVGEHRILGRNLERYDPEVCEYEEDKVVVEAPVSTQRLHLTAVPVESTPTPESASTTSKSIFKKGKN